MAETNRRLLSMLGMGCLGIVVTALGVALYLMTTATPGEREMLREGVKWEQIEGAVDQLQQPLDKSINKTLCPY